MFRWLKDSLMNRLYFERELSAEEWEALDSKDQSKIYPMLTAAIGDSHGRLTSHIMHICGIRYYSSDVWIDTVRSGDVEKIAAEFITRLPYYDSIARYLMSIQGVTENCIADPVKIQKLIDTMLTDVSLTKNIAAIPPVLEKCMANPETAQKLVDKILDYTKYGRFIKTKYYLDMPAVIEYFTADSEASKALWKALCRKDVVITNLTSETKSNTYAELDAYIELVKTLRSNSKMLEAYKTSVTKNIPNAVYYTAHRLYCSSPEQYEKPLFDLIEAKIGLDSTEGNGYGNLWNTPASNAVLHGQTKLLLKLIENGVNLTMSYEGEIRGPLIHFALHTKEHAIEMMQILLQHGADINGIDYRGDTILHKLIRRDYCDTNSKEINHKLIEFCLSKGADPKILNHEGLTALHLAVKDHNVTQETLDLLFKHHPNLLHDIEETGQLVSDFFNFYKDKPLFKICYIQRGDKIWEILNNSEIGMFLIPVSNTDLALCYQPPHINNLDGLSQKAFDDLSYKKSGWHKRKECDILVLKKHSYSPMQIATSEGNIAAMQYLIKKGTSLDVLDKYNHNLLHIAVRAESKEAVEILCKTDKVDINGQDNSQNTPLYEAASHFSNIDFTQENLWATIQMMRLLVSYGADPKLFHVSGDHLAGEKLLSGIFCDIEFVKTPIEQEDTTDDDRSVSGESDHASDALDDA